MTAGKTLVLVSPKADLGEENNNGKIKETEIK
jgi:hypothetical protein